MHPSPSPPRWREWHCPGLRDGSRHRYPEFDPAVENAAEAILTRDDDAGVDVTEGIMSLVDKSLLNVQDGPDGEPRIRMLQSIGSYAAERLDGEPRATALRERHARQYMIFAEEMETGLDGERPQDALARLDIDHDNLRAALDWSMDHDPGVGLRIGAAIWRFSL